MAPSTTAFRPAIGLVENDPSVRKALTRLLGSAGCGVVPFASPEQFLATQHEWVLDCLVLDVSFGGVSGLDLAATLRRDGTRFPIVFMSTLDDPDERENVKAAGYAYLRKPLEDVALLEAIQQVMAGTPR